MPALDTRCPCCQAPLLATVTDLGGDPQRGHDYDVSLEPVAVPASLGYCTDCRQVWDMVRRQYVVELCRRHGCAPLPFRCPRCEAMHWTMAAAEACSLACAGRGLARRE